MESTAMALHALAAMSVNDFEQFAEPAKQWIWSQQHARYWFKHAAPDPVWLTVLALDAIELAAEGKCVTFHLDATASASLLVFSTYQHNDTIWLEEPKKHLGSLVHSGAIEFFDDRQIRGGSELDPETKRRLIAAKIIIPLISPNVLGSKYTQTFELPTAIEES